jgi:hypothetical protein
VSPFMDFPAAWAFVRCTKPEQHEPKCSWRAQAGAFLCDCRVLRDERDRRKAQRATTPQGDTLTPARLEEIRRKLESEAMEDEDVGHFVPELLAHVDQLTAESASLRQGVEGLRGALECLRRSDGCFDDDCEDGDHNDPCLAACAALRETEGLAATNQLPVSSQSSTSGPHARAGLRQG